jgi:hypothetical protein
MCPLGYFSDTSLHTPMTTNTRPSDSMEVKLNTSATTSETTRITKSMIDRPTKFGPVFKNFG